MNTGHIVVVGSINMDLVVGTPRLPQIGETILGNSFATFPGGKGANQAVAAARLGADVKMVGRVGDDAFGDALIETLKSDRVDVAYIIRDQDAPTGVALITVDSVGQNTIVVASGANMQVTPVDVTAAASAFEGAAALILQLEVPLEASQKACELARKNGARIILNPAPARALSRQFLAQVDDLIPNQIELTLLTGVDSTSASIDMLHDWGIGHVIVTLGGDGALLVDGSQTIHLPAYNVPVIDTVAAGDAFVGAYAVALADGRSVIEAVRWANAAAAISVTRPGAQPSLPTRMEVDTFISTR